jgi:hypothetical protein
MFDVILSDIVGNPRLIIIKAVEEADDYFFYQDRVMNLLNVLWVVPSLTSGFALYKQEQRKHVQIYTD